MGRRPLVFRRKPHDRQAPDLLGNPYATVHLDGGGSAVIVDGKCDIERPSRQQAEGLVAASKAKYGYAPPIDAYLQGVWALWPERVLAWTDLTVDATRYLFT